MVVGGGDQILMAGGRWRIGNCKFSRGGDGVQESVQSFKGMGEFAVVLGLVRGGCTKLVHSLFNGGWSDYDLK